MNRIKKEHTASNESLLSMIYLVQEGDKVHAWEAIQETINYIEDRIDQDLSIEDLSQIAKLSQFYYQRLFTRLVKKPVREYIKLRRLARACESLRETKRIIDVALDYGFSSHATFTRAFKSTYKITPEAYRVSNIKLDNFDKPDLLLNYTMVDIGVPIISDGIVIEYHMKHLMKPICFAGVKGYYRFQKGKMLGERPGISEPSIIWNDFMKIRHAIEHVKEALVIGVSYPGDAEEGYSSYFAGIETVTALQDFEVWTLPAREYLVCKFEAENIKGLHETAVGKAMKHTRFWLKAHGLIADGFFPEVYKTKAAHVASMELWIPFRYREIL